MKVFFSILYISINSALDEKVSIGLVMSDGEQQIFKFSNEKLSIIKNLLNSESYNGIKQFLKSIDKQIIFTNKSENLLFNYKNSEKPNWYSNNYLSYLSKYSNNIIRFSEPKQIDINFSKENFIKIFEKNIFTYCEENTSKPNLTIFDNVRENLYPSIDGKVNIERTLTSLDIENLFAPVDVNFIGMNGVPVAGQTFDFEKKYYFLENDVTRFISLTKALELEGKKSGKYYILGREPLKKYDKNHLMWEHIRESNFLEFVDVNDVEIIKDYIDKNHVIPFFKEIE